MRHPFKRALAAVLAAAVTAGVAAGARTTDAASGRPLTGSGDHGVTSNGAANFAPYFLPGGKEVIFSSNVADPKGRDFDLWIVNDDGTGLERVTYNDTFDGFPMFSPDGKKLIFASNRHSKKPTDTNLYIVDFKW